MNSFESFKKSKSFKTELYNLGVLEEKLILPHLKTYFMDDTIIHLPEGHPFDFKGKHKIIELKTRTVASTTFKDTAIGINKINYAKNYSGDSYFVFKFTDSIYYWKYDSKLKLREFEISGVLHYFIPMNELILMTLGSL